MDYGVVNEERWSIKLQKVARRLALLAKLKGDDPRLDMEGSNFDPDWVKAAAQKIGSTSPAVTRALEAIEAGEWPGAASDETPEVSSVQGKLAKAVREGKTDEDIDKVMVDLAAGVLEKTVTIPEAKCAQGILMGRRYFLAQVRAAAKGGGTPIVAVQAPSMFGEVG